MVSDRELLEYLRGEKEREQKRTAGRSMLVGLFLGALAGVAAGVLMAPRPGQETRRTLGAKLAGTVERIKESMTECAEELKAQIDAYESESTEKPGDNVGIETGEHNN